jgi:hypothetical protein
MMRGWRKAMTTLRLEVDNDQALVVHVPSGSKLCEQLLLMLNGSEFEAPWGATTRGGRTCFWTSSGT